MTSRSEILIEAYRLATEPCRLFRRWQQGRSGNFPIVVLFYHRVADRNPTDWTISRSDFEAQMVWLQQHFEMLSMDQVYQRRQIGENSRPAVAITFDDGYAENMDFALPLLVELKIPCMYYVSTSFILNQKYFPHDEKLNLKLQPNSVSDLKQILDWGLDIGAHTRTHVDLGQIQDTASLSDELMVCRRELMNLLGVPIDHFAFPFGQTANITAAAVQMARRAGYKTVAAAYGGYNAIDGDPFFVQRIHGDPSLPRVKNWATLDPRWSGRCPDRQWLVTTSVSEANLMPNGRPAEKSDATLDSLAPLQGVPHTRPVADLSAAFPVGIHDDLPQTTLSEAPIISGR